MYNAELRERERVRERERKRYNAVEIPDWVEIKATSMQEEYSVCGMKAEVIFPLI